MKLDKAFEKVHYVLIDEHKAAQRIDNFLISYLKNLPKSKVYRIIRKGEVRVNRKRIKPEYKLNLNDEVRIPPLQISEKKEILPSSKVIEQLKNSIIYNDKELMAINKPSGIPVHGGTGITGGIINILRLAFPEYKFLELIHRLDKETSGCLLIAKTGRMLRLCQQSWQDSDIGKYYYCLVEGHWQKSLQKVVLPLKKNVLQSGERMVQTDPDGKDALTYFKPLKYFNNATLLEAKLGTGRTHQIRVHAASAGHPLAGDEKYGHKLFNQEMKKYGLSRLFLHAIKLKLPTAMGSITEIVAELPKELLTVIEKIKQK